MQLEQTPMKISKDKVITFFYSLKDLQGPELENNQGSVPMAYLHGYKNILPALEKEIEGMSEGESKEVTLSPENAYGLRNDNALQKVPIKHLAGKYKRLLPGMLVKVNTEKGLVNASVVKAGKFMVNLDMNHPFAGKTLVFSISIKSIREATAEEISHGHAHGEGGHHH